MNDRLEKWFTIPEGSSSHARLITLGLYGLLVTGVVSGLIFAGLNYVLQNLPKALSEATFSLVCLVLIVLLRRGYERIVRWALPLAVYFIVSFLLTRSNFKLFDQLTLIYPLLIILAGVLTGRRGIVVMTMLCLGAVVQIGLVQFRTPAIALALTPNQLLTVLALMLIFGALAVVQASLVLDSLRQAEARARELDHINRELKTTQDTLEERVAERSQRAQLAQAEAEAARLEAENAWQSLEIEAWLSRSQAELVEMMGTEHHSQALASKIIQQVCQRLNADAGILYITREGKLLVPEGTYSVMLQDLRTYAFGEGLPGQAAAELRSILLRNIDPADVVTSIHISSTLGQTPPAAILVHPFSYANKTEGVLEIAWIGLTHPRTADYLKRVSPAIAEAFQTTLAREQIDHLLSISQAGETPAD